MEFVYLPSKPSTYEGWLTKANIGIFERWQKRYFRLQGRCLYYFKKDNGTDPPNGNIPLIDIEINELPPRKANKYIFSIKLTKNPSFAKRAEYLINADTEEIKKKWIKIIHENKAISIVGQPFKLATNVSPTSNHVHLLLPYFIPELFKQLNETGYKFKNIWVSEAPTELITRGLAQLDMNNVLPSSDLRNTLPIVIEYLKRLPEGLISSDAIDKFTNTVTENDLKEAIMEEPAPIRQMLKEIALNLKKVVDNTTTNEVTLDMAKTIIGPFLIHQKEGSTIPQSQMTSIQEQVAACLIQNAQTIFEDIHQFIDAPKQKVIRCARVIEAVAKNNEELLEASYGLLVYVVREDSFGWCTVYTSNKRVGLIHAIKLKSLSEEEEKELTSGPNVDALLDVVRECCPEMMLFFEGMNNEISLIRDSFDVLR